MLISRQRVAIPIKPYESKQTDDEGYRPSTFIAPIARIIGVIRAIPGNERYILLA